METENHVLNSNSTRGRNSLNISKLLKLREDFHMPSCFHFHVLSHCDLWEFESSFLSKLKNIFLYCLYFYFHSWQIVRFRASAQLSASNKNFQCNSWKWNNIEERVDVYIPFSLRTSRIINALVLIRHRVSLSNETNESSAIIQAMFQHAFRANHQQNGE